MIRLPPGTPGRLGAAALLAGALLGIFLLSRRDPGPPPPDTPLPDADTSAIADLDAGIDSVLSRFGIDAGAVRKRTIGIGGDRFTRTERVVALPDSVVPVSVNAALNLMARRYGARAVASENPRLRVVTIHLDLRGMVVHTVILTRAPGSGPPGRSPRIAT